MPRPKPTDDAGKEVKKRSRNGCWPCKSRKVKCGEEKPVCLNCQRQGEKCDYSIRLNWDGRSKKKENGAPAFQTISFSPQPAPISPPANDSHPPLAPAPSLQISLPPNALPEPANGTVPNGVPTQTLPPVPTYSPPYNQQMPQHHAPAPQPPPILRTPAWSEPSTAGNGSSVLAPPSAMRQALAYPSPAETSFGSPGYPPSNFSFTGQSMQMPPPMPTSNPSMYTDSIPSPYNSAKRMRLSPRTDVFKYPSYQQGSYNTHDGQRTHFNPNVTNFWPNHLKEPLTPAASSNGNANDADDRRISVSSLLSEDPDVEDSSRKTSSTSYPLNYEPEPKHEPDIPRRGSLHQRMISYSETELYGHDRGLPDYDIPHNNDIAAISGTPPSENTDFESWLKDTNILPEFGFRLESKDQAFNTGGYYASPVPIKIPRKLEPLPPTLRDNPMNLLYFHHFLNHTARILVPHDCPENPFKTILPKMAVENQNLLHLMLAYSACHRARLLGHPEPTQRIAQWVRDVFPSLRQTLAEVHNTEISNANLATAIMLTSLEIISPSSFGVAIRWQDHLNIARSIVRARGGPNSVSRKDPVMFFLSRWLAYLDVLGSLSNRQNEDPLFEANYWQSSHDGASSKELSLTEDEDYDEEDDYTIDCLLGFTTRCVYILAQIASLARQCDPYRVNASTGQVNLDWRPTPDILKKADKLRQDLENARNHEPRQCHHHSPVLSKASLAHPQPVYPEMSHKDEQESFACNNAFHWAGLIHLLRRVHNLPRLDPQVQKAVHEIVKVLQTLRLLGSAEACLLFPIFTAGVEAEDPLDRAEVLARIKGAEGLGMCQVSRARKIMEECWKTGVSWESLVNGDFFG